MKFDFNKISLFILLAAAFSCTRLSSIQEGEVIARVGGNRLYLADVESLFTPGLSPQDSIKILDSYVDIWVKKQLKTLEAERIFDGNNEDIEKMVREYRSSLLSHKLDQYYVENKLDSSYYNENSIADYYNAHRSDFLLDRTVVKGQVVKLPSNFRQQKELREAMAGTGEKYQDFLDISLKNDLQLTEFDTWTDFSDFVSVLPVNKDGYDNLLVQKGVSEVKDGTEVYFVNIRDVLNPGDVSPLERVEDVIRRVLFNQRKQEIIRNYEDSIYKVALSNGEIDVKN